MKAQKLSISFLVISLLCFRIFTNIPMLFVRISGTGAPISSILWGLAFFIAVFFLTKKQYVPFFPNNNQNVFLKHLLCFVFLGYLFFTSVYYLRELSGFLRLAAFPTSPLWFIQLIVLTGAICGCFGGVKSIVRATSIFVPLFVVIFVLLIFSVFPQGNSSNLFPVLGTGAANTLGKSFWGITMYSDIALLFLLNSEDFPLSKYRQGILWGVLAGIVLNTAIIITFTAKIPFPVSQTEKFPLYLLLKEAYFGRFFHRIDAVMIIVSSLWTMISLSLNLHFITSLLGNIFEITSRRSIIFPVSGIIFFIASGVLGFVPYIEICSLTILSVTALAMIFSKGKEKPTDEN